MKNLRLIILIAFALTGLTLALPLNAQTGRYAEATLETKLTAEQVNKLKKAWETAKRPNVLVSVGVVSKKPGASGEHIEYDRKDEAVVRLETAMRGQLSRAFLGGVRDLAQARKNEAAFLKRLTRTLGEAQSQEADELLQERFDARIVFDIRLRETAGGVLVTESYELRDLPSSSYITTNTLGQFNILSGNQRDQFAATAITGAIIDPFAEWAKNVKTAFRISMLADSGVDRRPERLVRKIQKQLDEVDGVETVKSRTDTSKNLFAANLDIVFDGELIDLLDEIEVEVLEDLELDWNVMSTGDVDAAVFFYKAEQPAWHKLTDLGDNDARDQTRKRTREMRGLRLGIVVGSDIQEPAAAFELDGDAPQAASLDQTILQNLLSNSFGDLGFTVTDAASLRSKLDTFRSNAERYNHKDHLVDSLKDLDEIDYILHVNIDDSSGVHRMVARIYDPVDAVQISSAQWPDPEGSRLSAYPVNPSRPKEVARFLAGRLIERFDNYILDSWGSTQVRVRNFDNAQQVIALKDLVRDTTPGVRLAKNLQVSTAAATFDLVHEGDTDELIFRAVGQISAAYPGTEVQVLSNTLVVNMMPDTVSPEQLAKIRAARLAANPTRKSAAPSPHEPVVKQQLASETERLRSALRDVRGSVWSVAKEYDTGRVQPMGTAWTLADGLLATNAHVAELFPAEMEERNDSYKIVAFSDSDRQRRIVLGRRWVHPDWGQGAGTPSENFWLDVGIIEVIEGNAGKPIPLASSEDLDHLIAPIAAGYVGFPSNHTLSLNKSSEVPNKQAFEGSVNAIVDRHGIRKPGSRERAVMHDIQSSGGASGSPIINADGHVIALHNSGAVQFSGVKGDSSDGSQYVRSMSGFRGGVAVEVLIEFAESVGINFESGATPPANE